MRPIVTTALLAILAATAAAQQPHAMRHDRETQSHMDQMEEMMAPMMSAMAFTPDHLLARKDSLRLTAQQVARITALLNDAKTAHDVAAADAKAHMNALADVMRAAAPDTVALRQHFSEAHTAMGKAHWAMLAASAQARAALTDEQRARVERWAHHAMEHAEKHR